MSDDEFGQKEFHKLLAVICKGCEDREEFGWVMDLIFSNMPEERRNQFWHSYQAAVGLKAVIEAITGNDIKITTEPPKDEDLPDGVTPIRPH